jgi:hypothetical protein
MFDYNPLLFDFCLKRCLRSRVKKSEFNKIDRTEWEIHEEFDEEDTEEDLDEEEETKDETDRDEDFDKDKLETETERERETETFDDNRFSFPNHIFVKHPLFKDIL